MFGVIYHRQAAWELNAGRYMPATAMHTYLMFRLSFAHVSCLACMASLPRM